MPCSFVAFVDTAFVSPLQQVAGGGSFSSGRHHPDDHAVPDPDADSFDVVLQAYNMVAVSLSVQATHSVRRAVCAPTDGNAIVIDRQRPFPGGAIVVAASRTREMNAGNCQ